ncbi:flagellar M-ring protein [Paraliobacillus quinghaiensis]|uniref:Flagellar M-ring protein n=1 Tax=Paraliobacillus quinghaiensis TaxID=470815 RepID=A0A917WPL4_9BACI|nr:flagellar basal-body MS-ring/collar protein FliF [Paraliobacillus quinghaiensis]GGM21354.1 flagellar M-ring protein [Paraliobacillus quinghaiensis]
MKQSLVTYKDKIIEYWQSKSAKQKGTSLFLVLLFLVIVIGGSVLATRSSMVPLYNSLSIQEVGQIKAELDARGVNYEVQGGGTAIHVPSEQVNTLLVDLAAQGIPNNGSIDYSFFSENSSWGMTDNEFDVMKLDAMQTELANLITGISGIEFANVMINLPKEQVFVSDQQQEASASIVLETTPGYQFEPSQIDALYHLVSKTVPNLSNDNIVIMDGNFNYYDQNNQKNVASGDIYTTQQNVKEDIERDIQRRVQQMLGTMIGANKVVASVTADIDFTQENRIEELVEPVDEEESEGLPVSVEKITETYTGDGAPSAVPGGGEEDIANYPAGEDASGDYEMVQESINYEFSRIQREIVESPYKVRDLGIQIAIDNTKETVDANGEPELLTAQEQADVEASIASILNSIITTTIDGTYGEINPGDKTSIVFQEFNHKPTAGVPTTVPGIPTWVYITGSVLLLLVIGLIITLARKKNVSEEVAYSESAPVEQESFEVPDIEGVVDSESSIRRKQLEKMANDKPEEFAKLLRSWIADD